MYRINRKGDYKRKTTKIPRPFTNASFKANNDIWCHTRANATKHIPSLIITPNFLWTFSVKTYIRVKPHKMVYSMWYTNTHGKIVSCYYVKCYFIWWIMLIHPNIFVRKKCVCLLFFSLILHHHGVTMFKYVLANSTAKLFLSSWFTKSILCSYRYWNM